MKITIRPPHFKPIEVAILVESADEARMLNIFARRNVTLPDKLVADTDPIELGPLGKPQLRGLFVEFQHQLHLAFPIENP